ncbi:MAG: DUF4421 family protein [Flavobacteriales bacterium]|nr:DUF4421 family protein [Flavobacteriales bacterium]
MARRWLIATFACLVQAGAVRAQVFDKARALLNGDSLAPAKYDTLYVQRVRDALALSGVVTGQAFGVDITDSLGGTLGYSTNNATQYGFAVALNWLSFEATFAVPAIDPADARKGVTESRSFGLSTTGRHLWGKALWNSSKGFYAMDPLRVDSAWVPGDPYPQRTDLVSNTFVASVNYGFNKRHRYSHQAAWSQVERQRRSAGTGVIGGSFWFSRLASEGSLVPQAQEQDYDPALLFDRLDRYIVAVKGGYTHTFTFWQRGYINLLLLPGFGVQRLLLRPVGSDERSTDWQGCSVSELRAGAGYNGPRWYAGLSLATFVNSGEVNDAVSIGTRYTQVRFAVGLRVRPPKSGFLRSIGL